MISQFLIFLSFVLQATAQQETTQAAEETTTAKDNTGMSDPHLVYMSHRLWLMIYDYVTSLNVCEILMNYF